MSEGLCGSAVVEPGRCGCCTLLLHEPEGWPAPGGRPRLVRCGLVACTSVLHALIHSQPRSVGMAGLGEWLYRPPAITP